MDNGNNIRISGKDVVNARVEKVGGTDYFTATFNYTKPAGTAVTKDTLKVTGPDKNGAPVSEEVVSGSNTVILSDGATSGTLTVRVPYTRATAFTNTMSATYEGYGRNYIQETVGGVKKTYHTLPKNLNGVEAAPILITAYVNSFTGYKVTLLPAENGEFRDRKSVV